MTREEVLALAAEVGPNEAARRSGIPEGTIKSWQRRARLQSVAAARGAVKPEEAREEREPRGVRGGVPSSRARTPPLAPSTRRGLRRFVDGTVAWLATIADPPRPLREGEDPPPPFDFRQADAATRSLRNVFELAPGIDAFDEQTGGQEQGRGPTEADRQRLDAAMLEPPSAGRPGPRLVESG